MGNLFQTVKANVLTDCGSSKVEPSHENCTTIAVRASLSSNATSGHLGGYCSACGGDPSAEIPKMALRLAVGILMVGREPHHDLFEFNGDIWLVYWLTEDGQSIIPVIEIGAKMP